MISDTPDLNSLLLGMGVGAVGAALVLLPLWLEGRKPAKRIARDLYEGLLDGSIVLARRPPHPPRTTMSEPSDAEA